MKIFFGRLAAELRSTPCAKVNKADAHVKNETQKNEREYS